MLGLVFRCVLSLVGLIELVEPEVVACIDAGPLSIVLAFLASVYLDSCCFAD
jgi:hypothetical protein